MDNLEIKNKTKLKIPGYEELVEFGKIEKFAYRVYDSSIYKMHFLFFENQCKFF